MKRITYILLGIILILAPVYYMLKSSVMADAAYTVFLGGFTLLLILIGVGFIVMSFIVGKDEPEPTSNSEPLVEEEKKEIKEKKKRRRKKVETIIEPQKETVAEPETETFQINEVKDDSERRE